MGAHEMSGGRNTQALGVGDQDVTVFVTRGHCMTYPMPRMDVPHLQSASPGNLEVLGSFVDRTNMAL
jgi:hypothetical protein